MWLTEVCQSYTQKRDVNEAALKKARVDFELNWQLSHERYPTTTTGDTLAVSKRIYEEFAGVSSFQAPWSWRMTGYLAGNQVVA